MIIKLIFRLTPPTLDFIQELLDEDCALTLDNLIAKVRDEFQVVVCAGTMHNAMGRFRYSLKRRQNIAIAADTPANEALRLEFARWYTRITVAGRKVILMYVCSVGLECMFSRPSRT